MNPATPQSRPTVRGRVRSRLRLLGLAALLSLALVELSTRIWLESSPGERIQALALELDSSTAAFDGDAPDEPERPGDTTIAHPYFGWYGSLRESKIPAVVRSSRAAPGRS